MSAADSPTQIPGFRDRIGARFVVPQRSGVLLEHLYFCQPLASAPFFQAALKQRVSRLANFRQASYCRIRGVQHVAEREGTVALVSAHTGGRRLAEILQIAARAELKPSTSSVLAVSRQLMAAVALLHDFGPDVSHAALGPERVILAGDGRVVVGEHVLGGVIEQAALVWSPRRLWREFRVPVLPDATAPQFGRRVDVVQIGAVMLAMLLGRALRTNEYPDELGALLGTVSETAQDGGPVPLRSGLRAWLERALELRPDGAFRTLLEAQKALGQLIQDEGYGASSVAWDAFVSVCEVAAARLPLLVMEPEPPERPHEEPPVAPETAGVEPGVADAATVEPLPEAGAADDAVEAEIVPVEAEPAVVEPLLDEGAAAQTVTPEAVVVEPLEPKPLEPEPVEPEPLEPEPLELEVLELGSLELESLELESLELESLELEVVGAEPLAREDTSTAAAGLEPAVDEPPVVEDVAVEPLPPEAEAVEPLGPDGASAAAAGLELAVDEPPVVEDIAVEPLPADEVVIEPVPPEETAETAVEPAPAVATGAESAAGVPTLVEVVPQEEPAASPAAPGATVVDPPSREGAAEEPASEQVPTFLLAGRGREAIGAPATLAAAALGGAAVVAAASEATSTAVRPAKEPLVTPDAAALGVPEAPPGSGADDSEPSVEVGIVYETLGISAPPPRLLDALAPAAEPPRSTAAPRGGEAGAGGSEPFDDWAPRPDPAMNMELAPQTLFEVPAVPTPDVIIVAGDAPVPVQSTEWEEKPARSASTPPAQDVRPVDLDARPPAVVIGGVSRPPVTRPPAHAAPTAAPRAAPVPPPRDVGRLIRRSLVAGVALMVVAAAVYGLLLWAPWRRGAIPSGTVRIESNPPGATVTIDGQARGTTPVEVTLPAGPHQLQVQAGAAARSRRIVVAAGVRVTEKLALLGATARGGLRITTQPHRGRITIDGKVRGDAPIRVMDLEPGSHTMVVESPFGIQEHVVIVEAGKTLPVTVPTASWIRVNAPFELTVLENGRAIGTSNAPMMVAPGGHRLELENRAFALRLRQYVDAPLGQVVTVSPDVPLGVLNLFSDEKAEAWVDGKLVGETPLSGVPTPLGSHDIVFRHAKYGELRDTVTVTLAAPASVKVSFRKN